MKTQTIVKWKTLCGTHYKYCVDGVCVSRQFLSRPSASQVYMSALVKKGSQASINWRRCRQDTGGSERKRKRTENEENGWKRLTRPRRWQEHTVVVKKWNKEAKCSKEGRKEMNCDEREGERKEMNAVWMWQVCRDVCAVWWWWWLCEMSVACREPLISAKWKEKARESRAGHRRRHKGRKMWCRRARRRMKECQFYECMFRHHHLFPCLLSSLATAHSVHKI